MVPGPVPPSGFFAAILKTSVFFQFVKQGKWRQHERPFQKRPEHKSSRLALRAMGSTRHRMNHDTLESRCRISPSRAASAVIINNSAALGTFGCPSRSRRLGKMSHQRRATSSSDQPATTSGRLRKTTWRWLLITAKPRTSTPNARHAALRGIGSDRTETGRNNTNCPNVHVSCQSHPFASSPGSRDLRFSVRIVGGTLPFKCPSSASACVRESACQPPRAGPSPSRTAGRRESRIRDRTIRDESNGGNNPHRHADLGGEESFVESRPK